MIYLVRLFWGVPALLLLALLWVLSSTAGSQLVLDQASKHSGVCWTRARSPGVTCWDV